MDRITFDTKKEVMARFHFSSTTLHYRIHDGLFTPPVKIAGRIARFPTHEVDELAKSFVRGDDPEQVRETVSRLVAKRSDV